jgi:hypothetical protein
MTSMDAAMIGRRLSEAARLPGRAVCVYGSDEIPEGSVQLSKVDRCVARAIYKLSMVPETPAMHYGATAKEGICGGGQGWCGLTVTPPKLKYFVSTGTPDFMHGAAEFLKPTPESAERFFAAPGAINPPAKYINLAGWDQIGPRQNVLSYILIGPAESIRNMGGLIIFVSDDIFTSISMPGGPTCAAMVTYAAGMAEKAPQNAAFVGPVDPTGNAWFPPDMMSLAIPYAMAETLVENADRSFIGKRPQVAFPSRRLGMDEKGEHF